MTAGTIEPVGPVLMVRLATPKPWVDMNRASFEETGVPPTADFKALVDTGAMISTINPRVRGHLRCPGAGVITFRGVRGVGDQRLEKASAVAVDLLLLGKRITIRAAVIDQTSDEFDVLLGMDVLRDLVLTVNGPERTVKICRQ